jgi:peroxiredoxin
MKKRRKIMFRKQAARFFLIGLLLTSGPVMARLAWAIDIGDKAPEFTLPSTTGEKISLNQFRGKKLVLLEFYGADFSPV